MSIRVVLCDDNVLVREGVRALLGIVDDIDVVGVAEDAPTLLAAATAEDVQRVWFERGSRGRRRLCGWNGRLPTGRGPGRAPQTATTWGARPKPGQAQPSWSVTTRKLTLPVAHLAAIGADKGVRCCRDLPTTNPALFARRRPAAPAVSE